MRDLDQYPQSAEERRRLLHRCLPTKPSGRLKVLGLHPSKAMCLAFSLARQWSSSDKWFPARPPVAQRHAASRPAGHVLHTVAAITIMGKLHPIAAFLCIWRAARRVSSPEMGGRSCSFLLTEPLTSMWVMLHWARHFWSASLRRVSRSCLSLRVAMWWANPHMLSCSGAGQFAPSNFL